MFKSLEILGLRGFSNRQKLEFAIPNGAVGSGLTILVGANNAGKSTAVEALRALNMREAPSFTNGRRNKLAGDLVEIGVAFNDGIVVKLKSRHAGTSETEFDIMPVGSGKPDWFVLPSRRVFSPYFGKGSTNRSSYTLQAGFPAIRTSTLEQITSRLFQIQNNRQAFDDVMVKVVNPAPSWTIDQDDTGSYFLKLTRGDAVHSSEGMGEGLVSLIYIIDALYDSQPGQFIAIDEPELSLHPALQRKLAALLLEYAADRQIMLATHSPYFVNMMALGSGARIARVHLEEGSTSISQLSEGTGRRLCALLNDQNNPHVLGLNAQEVFFLDDKIVLVEGQEDVIFIERVEDGVGVQLLGQLFGWGVGGAEKMELVAEMLSELGFKKVVGILDGNKADLAEKLCKRFGSYRFYALPADDIRTKPPRKETQAVKGLLTDDNQTVRTEHVDATRDLLQAANSYFEDSIGRNPSRTGVVDATVGKAIDNSGREESAIEASEDVSAGRLA